MHARHRAPRRRPRAGARPPASRLLCCSIFFPTGPNEVMLARRPQTGSAAPPDLAPAGRGVRGFPSAEGRLPCWAQGAGGGETRARPEAPAASWRRRRPRAAPGRACASSVLRVSCPRWPPLLRQGPQGCGPHSPRSLSSPRSSPGPDTLRVRDALSPAPGKCRAASQPRPAPSPFPLPSECGCGGRRAAHPARVWRVTCAGGAAAGPASGLGPRLRPAGRGCVRARPLEQREARAECSRGTRSARRFLPSVHSNHRFSPRHRRPRL